MERNSKTDFKLPRQLNNLKILLKVRRFMFSFQEGEPCKVGVAMTDLSTGLYAHGAIMAAILQRQRTGQGQHIDCDLFSTQVSWSDICTFQERFVLLRVSCKLQFNYSCLIVHFVILLHGNACIGCVPDKYWRELSECWDRGFQTRHSSSKYSTLPGRFTIQRWFLNRHCYSIYLIIISSLDSESDYLHVL